MDGPQVGTRVLVMDSPQGVAGPSHLQPAPRPALSWTPRWPAAPDKRREIDTSGPALFQKDMGGDLH